MQNHQVPALNTQELPTQGPVEIDAKWLDLVAGGAPKSGWDVEAVSTASDPAPKSGW
jgi:hypothetical protein